VHDAWWKHDERACAERARAVTQVERELALDDEERVRVLAMDVSLRSSLARPVIELGDRELLGLDENRGSTLRSVRDAVALRAPCTADDDLGAAGGWNLNAEESSGLVSRHAKLARMAGRDVHPRVPVDRSIAAFERELTLENEDRLGALLSVAKRELRPGVSAEFFGSELLEVGEHGTAAY
jgi:hypothetical protein